MTCVQTQCVTVPLHTMEKSSRTKAAASGFSLSNRASYVRGIPEFSFLHTEPSQGQNSGSLRSIGTGEGQQYHQYPANSHDEFSFQMNHNGIHSTNAIDRSQWSASPAHESEPMSRLLSQGSTGAHAQRANHASSHDQARSSRMFGTVSQGQNISSRSDVTGRSSPVDSGSYTSQQLELQAFDSYPFSGAEDLSGQTTFHGDSINGPHSSVSMTRGQSFSLYATADDTYASLPDGPNDLANHVPLSQDFFNPSAIINPNSPSHILWNDSILLESRRSSPTLLEDWVEPHPQITTSTTNSPLDYSPSLEGLSPRYVLDFPDLVDLAPYTTGDRVLRKPVAPRQSKVVSDLQRHHGSSESSDESLRMVGRLSLDIDNTARDHPLYQNITPKADGLYHCPWEGQDHCQHKPEKLKCNYDKFVDSHLKPYRCKVHACENSRFSSTACLLRHEREAHAMHGHGDKPYLCTYEGCERGLTGNGFPRHWNLRDHMKRVHNDPGTSPKPNASPPPSNAPTRGKKRKTESIDGPLAKGAKREDTTPPAVAVQAQELILAERYTQSERRLVEIVKQLSDPRNVNNMTLLRSAGECIKVMAQTTQRLNPAPSKQSG